MPLSSPVLPPGFWHDQPPTVYGDGEQTRDFTFVANVVEANWKAATHPNAVGEAFNIGCGTKTSLNELIGHLNTIMGKSIQTKL